MNHQWFNFAQLHFNFNLYSSFIIMNLSILYLLTVTHDLKFLQWLSFLRNDSSPRRTFWNPYTVSYRCALIDNTPNCSNWLLLWCMRWKAVWRVRLCYSAPRILRISHWWWALRNECRFYLWSRDIGTSTHKSWQDRYCISGPLSLAQSPQPGT